MLKIQVIREQGIAECSGNVTGYYIKFVGRIQYNQAIIFLKLQILGFQILPDKLKKKKKTNDYLSLYNFLNGGGKSNFYF